MTKYFIYGVFLAQVCILSAFDDFVALQRTGQEESAVRCSDDLQPYDQPLTPRDANMTSNEDTSGEAEPPALLRNFASVSSGYHRSKSQGALSKEELDVIKAVKRSLHPRSKSTGDLNGITHSVILQRSETKDHEASDNNIPTPPPTPTSSPASKASPHRRSQSVHVPGAGAPAPVVLQLGQRPPPLIIENEGILRAAQKSCLQRFLETCCCYPKKKRK